MFQIIFNVKVRAYLLEIYMCFLNVDPCGVVSRSADCPCPITQYDTDRFIHPQQMHLATALRIFVLFIAVVDARTRIAFSVVDATLNTTISGVSCSMFDIKGNIVLAQTTSSQSGQCEISANFTGIPYRYP